MLQIQSPFQQLFDTNGSPLDDGYVYIGTANANPETSPIAIYWDDAGTIPAAQPLRTLNGYLVRSGTPARVYASLEDFSMTVKDRQGRVVFSVLDATSLSNLQSSLASSSGSSLVGFLQAGANAQPRTVQSKLRDVVSVKDFGAVGDGVADDTAAFIAAAATGKQLHIPYGDYVISSPVTISGYLTGEGSDDGQTTITLTGTGQLIVGDWHAHWDGFFIRSAVNSKKFIVVPGISYFKCTNFRSEKIGAATGQIAIEFDTTTASVYFNNIDNFKIKVDYPFNITGNNTQAFNANKIGTVATGYYQDFLSAIAVSGVLACDANQFAGYLEVGTNAVNHTAGAFRQNRLHFVLDAVTRAYNTSVTVTDQNIWEILDGGFTTGGTYPQNQILIGPPSTKVRATNATADSISNASVTVLKFDTEVYDTLSEFSNGSGIFTAKNAGYYYIDASALSASVAWDAGERWEIRVYKNGIEYAKGDWNAADAATTRQRGSRVSTTVYMNGTTDTVDVRVIHNQGGTVALDTSPTGNYIDIARLA